MARTRRSRGKRSYHSSSPAAPSNSVVSTQSGGRRSAAVAAANANKASVSGRTTQNSRGNRGRRGPGSSRKNPAINRTTNGRGRGRSSKKDSTPLHDPTSYTDESGEIYRRGDYAYIDSQQPELPYHICIIRDFKLARKETVIAEIKWFYRVSELPEAVYFLLMEDRKNDVLFSDSKTKERELFVAFNVDTHPASLLRGKCQVRKLSDVRNTLTPYMGSDHAFFYDYGYKPESRRLTKLNEESCVPQSQQAVLPEYLGPVNGESSSSTRAVDYYNSSENKVGSYEEMVWLPKLSDDDLLMYLRAARSIALHAGVCMTGYIADGYLAASSDETTQHAFDVLHRNNHSTTEALLDLVKRPMVSRLINKKNWDKESAVLFGKGMRQFGKNFSKIKKELLPNKAIEELVDYYYYWKKTNTGLTSRNTRRQRKMTHIRLSRSLLKPREITPEKEFMDWESCDEEETREFKGKIKSYYACRHCYSQQSTSWHHAGPNKTILCDPCRQYFLHYGIMCSLQGKKEPPEFMFKDYHGGGGVQDEISSLSSISHAPQSPPTTTGRKTRNSNGSRGGTASRPGLRSGKGNNKSDTDEEAEASGESGDDSSGEDEVQIPIKPKPLQARHSLLDNLEEPSSKTISDQPSKRQQRDDNMSAMSEEYGSGDSSNGDQDNDNSQKSPTLGEKSPGQSSSSSTHADDEGDSSSSSVAGTRTEVMINNNSNNRVSSSTPQQFRRVSSDVESTCARTDLIYVHPPPPELATKIPLSVLGSGGGGGGGYLLEQPNLPNTVKAPIITPHDPRLPMGPPTMMGFPLTYPPQGSVGGQHIPGPPHPPTIIPPPPPPPPEPATVANKRGTSMDGAGASSREDQIQQQQQQQQQQHMALWQQQQLAALHLQQQTHYPHSVVQTPGYMAGVPQPPSHSGHTPSHPPPQSVETSSSQHKPPQAFIFPEELHGRQRWEHLLAQNGIQVPPGMHPAMYPHLLESLYAGGGGQLAPPPSTSTGARQFTGDEMLLLSSGGAGARVIQVPAEMINGGCPPEAIAVSMEQLLAQQQQQQQQQQLVLAVGPEPPQMLELRQLESVAQQVAKDPSLFHNPQVQLLMQQREHYIHMQHQMQQHQRLQELMMQQEMQKKHFVLGRPPTGHDDSSPSSSSSSSHQRTRPGVIVNQSRAT